MKHLYIQKSNLPVKKILANWTNTADFIYSTESTEDLKFLLRTEIKGKSRGMIIERLKIRLLSLMKLVWNDELEQDIIKLKKEGV